MPGAIGHVDGFDANEGICVSIADRRLRLLPRVFGFRDRPMAHPQALRRDSQTRGGDGALFTRANTTVDIIFQIS